MHIAQLRASQCPFKGEEEKSRPEAKLPGFISPLLLVIVSVIGVIGFATGLSHLGYGYSLSKSNFQ